MSKPKLRIVVVEDQGVIALLLSEVLDQLGHDLVAVVATEAAAVDAAERWFWSSRSASPNSSTRSSARSPGVPGRRRRPVTS